MVELLGCPEIDLGQWGEVLTGQIGHARYPLGGTIELTERCNLRCVHCYINREAGDPVASGRELTVQQWGDVFDQVVEAGTLFLLFTGGEVLLRPDFAEIYRLARMRGLLVSLFTNATLVTPAIVDMLAEMPPHVIEVTLYGATAETYEAVTGVPGSYQRALRGIQLLIDRGFRTQLKSVLMTLNRHELKAMQSLAATLGVTFRYDATIWPRLDGGRGPLAYRLSTEEIVALDTLDPTRCEQWLETAKEFSGHLVRDRYVFSCGAGQRTFHIDSAGDMSICTMARRVRYSVLEMGFEAAWQAIGELRKLERVLDTPCMTCTAGGLCAQCPGLSQAMHGDDETPVDYICELGRLRAAQFMQAVEHEEREA